MTDPTTTDRHTCFDRKAAAGPAWECPRCSVASAVSLPPADQTARRETAEAVLAAVEVALGDTLVPSARVEALAGIAAVLPATTDQTAGWLDAAAECNRAGGAYAERGANDAAGASFALMETFLRKAGQAEYVATPCSGPVPCEDGGEPCDVHERLMGHAEGDHELCAPDCGEPWMRRVADETQPAETEAEPTAEQIARDHVTTLHLINEQLTTIEGWFWEHLADVRTAERPGVGARQDEAAAAPCVECDHPKAVHGEGDDPVTPGQCADCPDGEDRHDYRTAAVRQDGAES